MTDRAGRSTLSQKDRQYAHLYDNIWVSHNLHVAKAGIFHYPEALGLAHRYAYTRVSDHAPVYAILSTSHNDDLHPMAGQPMQSNQPPPRAHHCIDLNTASADRLDQLKYVGPARAKAIIKHRPYSQIGDLTRISGLGSGRVSAITEQGLVCSF